MVRKTTTTTTTADDNQEPRETTPEIEIRKRPRGLLNVCVIGRSPLIMNRMSEKAMRELLAPKGKMNAAEKQRNLKHDPLQEFRNSAYTNLNNNGPTRIQGPASWFKKGMMVAALDIPNTKKAQLGRLIYVVGDRIDIYGLPQILLASVRSSDLRGTPDIRSRAILPRWACRFPIAFPSDVFSAQGLANLLASAGVTAGAGDWRVEKGGTYGRYELVNSDDAEFLSILEEGRAAQDEAFANPTAYDDETATLLDWFASEMRERGKRSKNNEEVEAQIAAD
jgi:hypothetical protein